jgi:hypothetical protein
MILKDSGVRREFDFGKKKIIMTLKQIEDLFDSVNEDYLTIEDMKTVLSEELGIEFKE